MRPRPDVSQAVLVAVVVAVVVAVAVLVAMVLAVRVTLLVAMVLALLAIATCGSQIVFVFFCQFKIYEWLY